MPKASIELSEHANRVINVVKERDGLRGRSAAIARIVEEYEEKILDPMLRPRYVEIARAGATARPRRATSVYEIFG